jgi:cytochrome c-type biogenesis protein CcmH/NrfG
MMLNREKLSFWTRLVAIGLAVMFVGGTIFFGIGSNISYNPLDLFSNPQQQQSQTSQGPGPQDRIQEAEKDLRKDPDNPEAIKGLAVLYAQNGQLDRATELLERGRKVAPKDAEMHTFLGNVYYQRAASAQDKEQEKLYGRAGDAFAAATEIEPKDEDAYLYAGDAYDQAGQPGRAIQYWNGYLDLEPEGEEARQVKSRIAELLDGGAGTGEGN